MKNLYMIMRDGADIKVLPYEEGNALPVVYAENEEKALMMVEDIYRLKQMAFTREDVDNCISDMNEMEDDNTKYDILDEEKREYIARRTLNGIETWDDIRFLIENEYEAIKG